MLGWPYPAHLPPRKGLVAARAADGPMSAAVRLSTVRAAAAARPAGAGDSASTRRGLVAAPPPGVGDWESIAPRPAARPLSGGDWGQPRAGGRSVAAFLPGQRAWVSGGNPLALAFPLSGMCALPKGLGLPFGIYRKPVPPSSRGWLGPTAPAEQRESCWVANDAGP